MNINNIKTMFELNIILDAGYEIYYYLDDEFLPVYELRHRQELVNNTCILCQKKRIIQVLIMVYLYWIIRCRLICKRLFLFE